MFFFSELLRVCYPLQKVFEKQHPFFQKAGFSCFSVFFLTFMCFSWFYKLLRVCYPFQTVFEKRHPIFQRAGFWQKLQKLTLWHSFQLFECLHLSRTEILAEKGVLNNSGRFLKCPFVKKVSRANPAKSAHFGENPHIPTRAEFWFSHTLPSPPAPRSNICRSGEPLTPTSE